jgi:hypothetical protein
MTEVYSSRARGGAAEVVYVLMLLQAAIDVLALLGLLLLMGGNPVYLVVGLGGPALLIVVASAAGRRRRWGLITAVVLECQTLAAFQLTLIIGWIPQIDMTVNLVELVSQLALPLAVIIQCLRLLTGAAR